MTMAYCKACGKEVHNSAATCPNCGVSQTGGKSVKSQSTAFWWCAFLGGFGAHRFYLGQALIGVLCFLFSFSGIPFLISIVDLARIGIMKPEDWAKRYNNGVLGTSIGMFPKVIAFGFAGIIALSVAGGFVAVISGKGGSSTGSTITELENAQVANIDSVNVGTYFNLNSEHTDLQRENLLKEIKGKVVVWELKVYEVEKRRGGYEITTHSSIDLGQGAEAVGTFIHLTPRDDAERAKIESLKTGSLILVRGRISGSLVRNLQLDPAVFEVPHSAKQPTATSAADQPVIPAENHPQQITTPSPADTEKLAASQQVAPAKADPTLNSLVGKPAFEVATNTKAMSCLLNILGADKWDDFKDSIGTADTMTQEDTFIVGSGCLPHACGEFESIFAISSDGSKCYAATLRPTNVKTVFGTKIVSDLPPSLLKWLQVKK